MADWYLFNTDGLGQWDPVDGLEPDAELPGVVVEDFDLSGLEDSDEWVWSWGDDDDDGW